MPREFSRNQRLGTQLLRTLSELLRFETKDPRIGNVSLTAVDLSRDLSVARVYFSLLDPDQDPVPTTEALTNAAGFLRSKLGKAIKVRHVPQLRFMHDDSAEQAVRIGRLIDRTIEAEAPDSTDEH
ncbi:MAG: 30S ribosome-binding factor RbfA [Gammaproteobacteria bacterium]|nr:30S ribosome-binding factor RbfA [Gammaproteobacteria bacterium]